jgi:hypothetical protein
VSNFDDGEVLGGLEESWTFMGATALEWGCGLTVFIMVSMFAESAARAMPFMLVGWLATTITMSLMRRSFPDQQRGVVNAISVAFEIAPPGIPAPSRLQPIWSASPIRQVNPNCKFVELGLDKVFPSFQREYQDSDDGMHIGQ